MLEDGKSVKIGGKEYCVSHSLLRKRTEGPAKKGADGKGLAKRAAGVTMLAVTVVAAVYVRAVRVALATLGGVAAGGFLLTLLGMGVSERVKGEVVSRFLPSVMKGLHKAMRDVKLELLKGMHGDVLDFGAGDGAHLDYIKAHGDVVDSVVSLEPMTQLHANIRARADVIGPAVPVEIFGGFSSDLLRDRGPNQFDFIIVGNVLCEVPDQAQVIRELHELVKPGGIVYFSEHVSSDPDVSPVRHNLEHAANPLWHVVSGGCNLNRDTLVAMREHAPWDVYSWELTIPGLISRFHTGLAVKRHVASRI